MTHIDRPDCPKAHNGCTCICHTTPGVHHRVPCCYPIVPGARVWRVAEFWSSADPARKVLMLAQGRDEIKQWEQRGDFVRWCSPITELEP